ncbi:hypothetical protein Ancab_032921 [Ancistrocladus abbreviatus]
MMCFFFRNKSKNKKAKSAPELRNQSSSTVQTNRATGSADPVSSSRSIPELYKEKEQNLRVFTYTELREATNDFNRMFRIGEGGFGTVYKGTIRPASGQGNPVVVAIKKLNKNGGQGHKEWLAEVHFLGVVHHPNLVKLLGYCSIDAERGIQRLLVYEYMPNKSLEHHLFSANAPALLWKTRLEIMLGSAEGLAYLHEGVEVQPVGTYGYAAPEYLERGHLSAKSDIYSFGVVLYEILTGRRTIERDRPTAEQKLLEWVKQFPAYGKRFYMIMDFRLRNQYSINAARKIAKLADRCLSRNAKDRPDMHEIIQVLKEAILESEEASSSTGTTPRSPKVQK